MTAWALAALTLGAVAVLWVRTTTTPLFSLLLAGFFLLAAAGISFSNWVDRQTVLHLDQQGVSFYNGLRKVDLDWNELRSVRVYPSSLGDRVHVLGEKAHFHFRLLREVSMQGRVRGRTGFPDGEAILETLLEKTQMKEVEAPAPARYYA